MDNINDSVKMFEPIKIEDMLFVFKKVYYLYKNVNSYENRYIKKKKRDFRMD